MPYVLRLATPDTRDLVVEALRSAASQRTRVATRAAREVAKAKADRRDVRSQAVKVTALLAEAAELGELADELAAATEVAVMSVDQAGKITTVPIPDPTAPARTPREVAEAALEGLDNEGEDTPPEDGAEEDDGTSLEAQRLAQLAGLTEAVVDPDAPDVDTGSIGEDEPTTVEEVDLDEYR